MSIQRNIVGMTVMFCTAVFFVHAANTVQSVRIVEASPSGKIARRASEILAREIHERSGIAVTNQKNADLTINLAIKEGVGVDGFTISNKRKDVIRIVGNDENGLLYGVGKFLHTSRYDLGGFTPGTWRGSDLPKGDMRGIYFATHFNNWYEAASDEERQHYLESMALWGINALMVCFPNQQLEGFNDPKSIESLRKLNLLMTQAKTVGMKVGIVGGNHGFSTSPREWQSTYNFQCWGTTLCPSKPEAMRLLENDWERQLEAFRGPGLDFVVYWPYDEGGCACASCAPWGANGFPKMCQRLTTVLHKKYPQAKVVLSTWLYDLDHREANGDFKFAFRMDGEYAGLNEYLLKNKGWADYVMIDAHEVFPDYPLRVGIPGNLPMINFPEISMYGQSPWGGFGANPFPAHLQRFWDQAKDKLSGGFPYSEGIYEDINKIVCSRFYWNPQQLAFETVREYIAYEYSPSVVDSVAKVVELLERNHLRRLVVENRYNPSGDWFRYGVVLGGSRTEFQGPDNKPLSEQGKRELQRTSEEAFRLMDWADKKLTPQARTNWRWRILYLRALIDRELVRTDGWFEGPVLQAAFEEMTKISHSQEGATGIHVPKIDDATIKYSH